MGKITKISYKNLFNKNSIFFSLCILSMFFMFWYGYNSNYWNMGDRYSNTTFLSGRIIEIIEDNTSINEAGARVGQQTLLVRLLQGTRRGEIVEVNNLLFPIEHSVFGVVGQRVLVFFDNADGHNYFSHIQSYDRTIGIWIVIIGFLGLLALVFGKSGIRSAFSLVFTFFCIIFWLLPIIVNGTSPIISTIFISIVIIVVSIISIMGFGKKTVAASVGSVMGILSYAISYYIISFFLNITGFNVSQIDVLVIAGFATTASELLFASILIASIGGIMDVAVSLASSTYEISISNPKTNFKYLFISGMKVGRDIIGSSANTLILAFTGAFFIQLLLFSVTGVDVFVAINRTDISIEILRAIASSSAIILVAPATVLFSAKIMCKK
ncbi:MAG: YibE/F family protein [Defluviitaleaceae bacterium]|nr:YibE/F family protein [Defluviitaleaceae bacterium]